MSTRDTWEAALARAVRLARQSGEDRHVVQADEDGYAVASDFDLETYWLGATVLATALPDGELAFDG
jgi:hypothetical protein